MNISEAFPSKYLKAGDLPDEGTQTFTIEKIQVEEIGKNKDKKWVIHFEESDKALVCNKTNAKAIARVTGTEDFGDWVGKTISLYRTEVEFQGDMVEAIRVKAREAKPTSKMKPKQEVDEDGIPF